MKRAAPIAATLTLALARFASAGWMPPVTISDSGDLAAGLPTVAIDKKGNAIAVWRGFDGTNYRIRAAFRPAGGTFGAVHTLSDPGEDAGAPFAGPQVAFERNGNAIAIWYRSDGTNNRIETAVRPVGGAFGSAQPISDPGSDARFPSIAIDAKGNAIAVWSQTEGADDIVRAAVRPAGGTFGAALPLSDPGGNALAPRIAIDKKRNAIAVWRRSETTLNGVTGDIQASIRPDKGTFQLAQTISDLGEDAYEPEIAFDRHRNAIAVWSAYLDPNYRIRAAFRPVDGTFEAAQTLSAAGQDARAPQIAIDGKGNAIALWTRSDGAYDRTQAALRPVGGTFTAPDTLSDPGGDAEQPQIAFDKRGNAIAIWHRDDGTNGRIQAAFRLLGGAFGAAETLTPPGDDGSFPQLAFDKKRNALAVWSVYEGATSKIQAADYTH